MDIKTLIENIDKEIWEIKKDTNHGISWLGERLISLSKQYWEAKRDRKNGEASYKYNTTKKKEDREDELKKTDAKITDAELLRYAERELKEDYKAYKEKEAEASYLEPILEQYNQYVNGIKYDGKTSIAWEKFYK